LNVVNPFAILPPLCYHGANLKIFPQGKPSMRCCASLIPFIFFSFTVGLAIPSGAQELTIFAQAYTPEIATGDNPRPLPQFTYLARRYERLPSGRPDHFHQKPGRGFPNSPHRPG